MATAIAILLGAVVVACVAHFGLKNVKTAIVEEASKVHQKIDEATYRLKR